MLHEFHVPGIAARTGSVTDEIGALPGRRMQSGWPDEIVAAYIADHRTFQLQFAFLTVKSSGDRGS
jgi:hypothetical protein